MYTCTCNVFYCICEHKYVDKIILLINTHYIREIKVEMKKIKIHVKGENQRKKWHTCININIYIYILIIVFLLVSFISIESH